MRATGLLRPAHFAERRPLTGPALRECQPRQVERRSSSTTARRGPRKPASRRAAVCRSVSLAQAHRLRRVERDGSECCESYLMTVIVFTTLLSEQLAEW